MTPARHQRVRCPLPPTNGVSMLPVTKGHRMAWLSGASGCPGSRKRREARCRQEPAARVYSVAQVSGSHPLISAALGQRAMRGLIKHPAAGTQRGPVTISGTHCTPAHGSARELGPHGRAGPSHGTGRAAGPSPRPRCYQGPAEASSALWQLFVGLEREKHPGRGSHAPALSSPAVPGG